jgi:hypothetical protein
LHQPTLVYYIAPRTEGLYLAHERWPEAENVVRSLQQGLEAVVFDYRMPAVCSTFLVKYHNSFDKGANTTFVEQVMLIPQAAIASLF